jgi:predicted membrane metal-binding protein
MKLDYYTSTGMKIVDFLAGFLGIGLVLGAIALFSALTGWVKPAVLSVVAYVVATVVAFMRGRRFIGIGMLCFLLIPILVFGACVLTFKL